MAVLSPETLEQILGIPSEYIDCSGLKLHIEKIFRFKSYGRLLKDSKELPIVEEVSLENGVYKLEPGAYRIRYAELVKVPPNAIALAIPRSSLLRMGVTIYTAAWDPGPGFFGPLCPPGALIFIWTPRMPLDFAVSATFFATDIAAVGLDSNLAAFTTCPPLAIAIVSAPVMSVMWIIVLL